LWQKITQPGGGLQWGLHVPRKCQKMRFKTQTGGHLPTGQLRHMCRYFPGEPAGMTDQRAPPPGGHRRQLGSHARRYVHVDIFPMKIHCWKAASVTVNSKACVRPVREATPPTVSTIVTQMCGSESGSSDRIKLRGEPN
jgi:hypothetical protein